MGRVLSTTLIKQEGSFFFSALLRARKNTISSSIQNKQSQNTGQSFGFTSTSLSNHFSWKSSAVQDLTHSDKHSSASETFLTVTICPTSSMTNPFLKPHNQALYIGIGSPFCVENACLIIRNVPCDDRFGNWPSQFTTTVSYRYREI
jgi:hypothetical protein